MNIKYDVNYLTVNELFEILSTYKKEGLGDRIVMIENPFIKELDADYVTVRRVDKNDSSNLCIYLDANFPEDEKFLIDRLFRK